jgi:hypothetical protein
MKAVTGLTVLAVAASMLTAIPASAKLTPNDGLTVVHTVDRPQASPAAKAAMNEHDYFQAPADTETAARTYRCTVRAVVFEKMQLAKACY